MARAVRDSWGPGEGTWEARTWLGLPGEDINGAPGNTDSRLGTHGEAC